MKMGKVGSKFEMLDHAGLCAHTVDTAPLAEKARKIEDFPLGWYWVIFDWRFRSEDGWWGAEVMGSMFCSFGNQADCWLV